MSAIITEVENIADAINSCDVMADNHTFSARRIFSFVTMLTLTLVFILLFAFLVPTFTRTTNIKVSIPDAVLYVSLSIYVLTFGVLMAIYRLHIGEASRLQHYKVGFMRVRVAGSNPSPGYQSEVRAALTMGAFDFLASAEKKGKIESPVLGHPGSDLAAAVASKVLEGFDSVRKERKPRSTAKSKADESEA